MPDGSADVGTPTTAAITVDGVPPISQALAQSLRPYGETRSATALSWNPADRSLLIATRFASTLQLHQVASPMGARRQLTFEPERIVDARWAPSGDVLVAMKDVGGGEFYQLYAVEGPRLRLLTDGKSRNIFGAFSPDGRLVGLHLHPARRRQRRPLRGGPARPRERPPGGGGRRRRLVVRRLRARRPPRATSATPSSFTTAPLAHTGSTSRPAQLTPLDRSGRRGPLAQRQDRRGRNDLGSQRPGQRRHPPRYAGRRHRAISAGQLRRRAGASRPSASPATASLVAYCGQRSRAQPPAHPGCRLPAGIAWSRRCRSAWS